MKAIFCLDWVMPVTGSIIQNSTVIIGVAGGSGSGKTYFATALKKRLGEEQSAIIYQDNFYKDQSKRFDFDGGSVNFDHPDALDFSLLAVCLGKLKKGITTQIPIYDFVTHSRLSQTIEQGPKRFIIVDGILILHSPETRAHLDYKIYFDTPESLRYQRRLERDVKERGRTPEGVENQFQKQVKPMHDLFVEPSKAHADRILTDKSDFDKNLADCCDVLAKLAL